MVFHRVTVGTVLYIAIVDYIGAPVLETHDVSARQRRIPRSQTTISELDSELQHRWS
jgi:hypothetical protein